MLATGARRMLTSHAEIKTYGIFAGEGFAAATSPLAYSLARLDDKYHEGRHGRYLTDASVEGWLPLINIALVS